MVIGLAGVIVMCLCANFLVADVLNIETSARERTVLAMYIASAIIFVSMLNQLFSSMLQGIHRFDVYSKIFTANSFVLIAGNLVLAYLGYGLLQLLSWNLGVLLIFGVIYSVVAKRLLPEFKLRLRFSRETIFTVIRYSSGIVGYQILANLLLLFERGWITHRLGSENLTYYVVPMSIGMYLHGFISSLVLVIFPLASELKDERERLLKLYTKATKIISLIVIFVIASVVVNSQLFLGLWMGPGFVEHSSNLLVLHVITFGLAAILTVSWQMSEGLGYPQYNVAIFSVCLVVSVALMLALTNGYGNSGVAVARLAGFGTIFFSIFLVERLFFKHVQTRFWLTLAGCLGAAGIFGGAMEYLVTAMLAPTWFTFLLSVFSGSVVFAFVLWLLDSVTVDEKILIRSLIRR